MTDVIAATIIESSLSWAAVRSPIRSVMRFRSAASRPISSAVTSPVTTQGSMPRIVLLDSPAA